MSTTSDYAQHKLDEEFERKEARREHNRRVLEGARIIESLNDRMNNHCDTWAELECLWPLRAKVRAFFGGNENAY